MSQSKPTKSHVRNGNRSASKLNSLAMSSVLLLAIAVTGALCSEVRNRPDGEIERPSRAATAFVPRLGKRLASQLDGQRLDSIGRFLCANSFDCNQLVLLGALVSGIAGQDGEQSDSTPGTANDLLLPSSFDRSNEDGLKLLRMLHRDQLLRRETRTSPDGSDELSVAVGGQTGTKRVAFTPRIGRRR